MLLGGLFAAAFVAGSVIPFQSELVFAGLLLADVSPFWALVAVASTGNTLGAVLNYALGRGALRFQGRRWFPVRPASLARAERWYARWGVWSLLLSWVPMGGLVTLVAGVMRTPLWLFLPLVAVPKTLRYIALGWATAKAAGGWT